MPPKQASTTKRKGQKIPSKRVVDPCVLEQVNELLEVLTGGNSNADHLNALQISEASIKLGINIDVDLAHSMIEFVTGHEDDFEITRAQFVETLERLVGPKTSQDKK